MRTVAAQRVRYGDTDSMGVVYYANYLRYFEVARVEYLRMLGQNYREIEAGGLVVAVVEATCRYHQPARFDDLLALRCGVSDLQRSRFHFDYEVRRMPDETLVASGRTLHACLDKCTLRPVRVPEELIQAIRSFEARPG
jgi:acyl-CoA thioester hydrolase